MNLIISSIESFSYDKNTFDKYISFSSLPFEHTTNDFHVFKTIFSTIQSKLIMFQSIYFIYFVIATIKFVSCDGGSSDRQYISFSSSFFIHRINISAFTKSPVPSQFFQRSNRNRMCNSASTACHEKVSYRRDKFNLRKISAPPAGDYRQAHITEFYHRLRSISAIPRSPMVA